MTHFKKKTFDEWALRNGETVRVSIDNYQGHDLVHVRRWQRGPNGRLYPTEKGAAIGIGHLSRLLKALRAVRAHARKIGVLPPRSRPR
jgi:Transcriptional Coactivator p15 (PC4)